MLAAGPPGRGTATSRGSGAPRNRPAAMWPDAPRADVRFAANSAAQAHPEAEELTCPLCGMVMMNLHCKLSCPGCGYREDCSDLFRA